MNNRIILVLNLKGTAVGGAQKRYITLFNYIRKEKDNYYLVINRSLYNTFNKIGLLIPDKNVYVMDIIYDRVNCNIDYSSFSINQTKKKKLGA